MAKTSSKPIKAYNCTQSELYAICFLIWNSCKKHIAAFASLKAYYTLTFIADRLSEVLAASNITDTENRINIAERLRNSLMAKADECCAKWQTLKVYIVFRYGSDSLKTWLQDAGESYYLKAANHNWEMLGELMKKGSRFIADNLTELQAGNNMPAAFQAQFDQLKDDAMLLYMQFQEALDNSEEGTTQKINANNAIYKQVTLVCKDGQQIFRNDAAKKEEFTFIKVLERVRGASSPYQEFDIPKNSSITIKRIVASSPFTNSGDTELVVCNGDVTCTPGTGIAVPAGAVIIIEDGVSAITVLNPDTTKAGKCKARVTKS